MFPDFISSYTPHLLSADDSVLCLNSEQPVDYPSAVSFMQSYAKDIREKNIPESIWFLEHPDIYTAGTSANPNDLLWNNNIVNFQLDELERFIYGEISSPAGNIITKQDGKAEVEEKKVETEKITTPSPPVQPTPEPTPMETASTSSPTTLKVKAPSQLFCRTTTTPGKLVGSNP